MLAITNWFPICISKSFFGVTVTFHSAADSEIRDRVVVRLENLCSSENFVAKGVESNECNSDVGGSDPFLQNWRAFEVRLGRSTFKGGENHVAARDRSDL